MNAFISLITGHELETAPPGIYIMQVAPGVPFTQTFERIYDFEHDRFIEHPPSMVLMARVREDDGRPLPKGTFDAYVRKDGRQVIKA